MNDLEVLNGLVRLEKPTQPVIDMPTWTLMEKTMDMKIGRHRYTDDDGNPASRIQTKRESFQLFTEKLEQLHGMYQQLHTLLVASVTGSNGFPACYCFPEEQIPVISAGAGEAVGSDFAVQCRLGGIVRRAVNEMMAEFLHRLWWNVASLRMGLANWVSEDVMQYADFRYKAERNWSHRTETSTHYQDHYIDTETHSLSVHDVIDAKEVPISEFKEHIPQRAQKVIGAIPDWLKPGFRVADGTEVRKTTVSREVKREAWSDATPKPVPIVRYDPCLTFGPYVLCAWEDGER